MSRFEKMTLAELAAMRDALNVARQDVEAAMIWTEDPRLYDVARTVCHEFGVDWTDPRTGITHEAPKHGTTKRPTTPRASARQRRTR